jgi:uncharacterized protein
MKVRSSRALIAASLAVLLATPAFAEALPKPQRVVTDHAGILSEAEVATLEQSLVAMRRDKLAEAIVYIAEALPEGAVLEELTLRSVNDWGVGERGIDNGLAIFVFLAERKVRIEVGLGLGTIITDAEAARVIDERIVPAFRRQEYGEGLRDAISDLGALLRSGAKKE